MLGHTKHPYYPQRRPLKLTFLRRASAMELCFMKQLIVYRHLIPVHEWTRERLTEVMLAGCCSGSRVLTVHFQVFSNVKKRPRKLRSQIPEVRFGFGVSSSV